jgi:ABC-type multidrug transport system ATPase subunit
LDKLITQTWKAPQQDGYKGELQRLVNSLTLKQLLTLAATTQAPESVRGIALMEIEGLKTWMHSKVNTATGGQKANFVFGLSQIAMFEKNPAGFKPEPSLNMPDGSPIGE